MHANDAGTILIKCMTNVANFKQMSKISKKNNECGFVSCGCRHQHYVAFRVYFAERGAFRRIEFAPVALVFSGLIFGRASLSYDGVSVGCLCICLCRHICGFYCSLMMPIAILPLTELIKRVRAAFRGSAWDAGHAHGRRRIHTH